MLTSAEVDRIVEMAWEDRTPFEAIDFQFNLKEKEIINLKEDQAKFKSEIDSHRINYENLVDKATLEIESFIKKHEVNTKVQ